MIDAGYSEPAKNAVIPYLKKLGIEQIDHFFITHPHLDHYEGLAAIIGAGIPVKNVYYKIPAPEVEDCCYNRKHFLEHISYAKDNGAKLMQPKTGFKLSLPQDSEIELLHAQEGNLPDANLDVNDLSLIMKWRIYGSTVLFTGDLNQNLGAHLTGDARMTANFLKMPHHGAASLAPNSFFETVNPDFVLVPGPEWTWCGERGSQPRKWTKSRKVPTWVNGIHGHITVEFDKQEPAITPEYPDGRCI